MCPRPWPPNLVPVPQWASPSDSMGGPPSCYPDVRPPFFGFPCFVISTMSSKNDSAVSLHFPSPPRCLCICRFACQFVDQWPIVAALFAPGHVSSPSVPTTPIGCLDLPLLRKAICFGLAIFLCWLNRTNVKFYISSDYSYRSCPYFHWP